MDPKYTNLYIYCTHCKNFKERSATLQPKTVHKRLQNNTFGPDSTPRNLVIYNAHKTQTHILKYGSIEYDHRSQTTHSY
jgi:hypothetical protein